MLNKYETKTYIGEGPFNGWSTVFKNGEPIFASRSRWGNPYSSSTIQGHCEKADNEHLARTLLTTPPFKDALKELKEDTGQKGKKKTDHLFGLERSLH